MAIRNIFVEGEDILRKQARPVDEVTDKIRLILDDMLDTMRDMAGVGLAAPQVGILKRIFVVEVDGMVYELINPEIVETRGEIIEEEGCLSVPGKTGMVSRPEYVRIKGLDRNGNEVEYEGSGLLAKAFCHENDHLNGILYIDKAEEMFEAE